MSYTRKKKVDDRLPFLRVKVKCRDVKFPLLRDCPEMGVWGILFTHERE